jgi:hypothetical protein
VISWFRAFAFSTATCYRYIALRDFTDEELTGALTELEDGVLARQKEASSWERYQREVLSGSLVGGAYKLHCSRDPSAWSV